MIKNLTRVALSIGISLAILALLVKMVSTGLPEGDRPSVLLALKQTSFSLALVYVGVYLIQLFIRAYRYQILIRISGESNVPNLRQMAIVTGIRNMFVDMLPARLGEIGYVGLLNRGYGVKLQHCVSSLAISIAFDFVALLFVVILVLAAQLAGGGIAGWGYAVLASACVLSCIAFLGLFWIVPRVVSWMKSRGWQATQERFIGKIIGLAYDFSDSLISARDSGKALTILTLSVAIRVLKYFSFYMLFIAVAKPSFTALAELPTEQIVSALIGGELGASLPIPTFMSFGAYEAGGALVFHLLDIANKAQAVVTLLCVHIWSQLVDYLFGGLLLLAYLWFRKSVNRSSISQTNKTPRWVMPATLIMGSIVFVSGTFFLAWELRAAKKLGAITPPEVGVSTQIENSDWLDTSKKQVSNAAGFMVWSSNRSGNHDIYRMDFPSMHITQLTNHPHTEYFARLSPDGKRLIFSRSHQPWVSQRNTVAWDIVLMDIATGKETVVARNATYGIWLDNGQISYLKNGHAVVNYHVDNRVTQIIYKSGDGNSMPKTAKISTPEFDPDSEQLLFTGRQSDIGTNTGFWGTAIMQVDGSHRGVFNGCQISWSFDRSEIYQVTTGGTQGTRFVQVDPETFSISPWIDLNGEFGHEYWPKDSSNGEYVVFGASRGDHEHDQADYEMFLWKTGSDLSKATRLTFHTGNDNWPDIHIQTND